MAEISRFHARMAVDQLRIAGKNQQRCETRRNGVGLADAIVLQMEFVEFARRGQCSDANAERELRCMVFGQISALWS